MRLSILTTHGARRALSLVGALGLVAACTDGGDPLANCPDESLTLELGTGANDYEPVGDGDTLEIIAGNQGGYHVDASGLVGPLPQSVQVTGTLTTLAPNAPKDQRVVASGQAQVDLAAYDDPSCTGEFWGMRLFTESNELQRICQITRAGAVMEVTVGDLDGTVSVTESVEVQLRSRECQNR